MNEKLLIGAGVSVGRRAAGTVLAALSIAGFAFALLSTWTAWLWRHENPEAINGPIIFALISAFLALLAWRISLWRAYAWLAAIGIAATAIGIAILLSLW